MDYHAVDSPLPRVVPPDCLHAAAILGLPLPQLCPSIFSHEFELPTMEMHYYRLLTDISVQDGHVHTTEYPLSTSGYKP